MKRQTLAWSIPLAALVLAALLSPFIDMPVSAFFYDQASGGFMKNPWLQFLYDWGEFPGLLVFCIALATLVLSYFRSCWKPWRNPALMLVLTMIIGAGLLTNVLLKDHWGRPRPKQVVEFGGSQQFHPVYRPNFFEQPEPSKSFPCGHCAMGFYFFAFMFVGSRLNKPWVYYGGLLVAVILGTALSFTRIAQGGHFLSDTITSASIMWLTAYLCDWLIYGEED